MKPPLRAYVAILILIMAIASYLGWEAFSLKGAAFSKGIAVLHAQATPQKPVTLLAVGDIMLGRNVETLMSEHGQDYPFAYVHDLLQGSDLTMANLEGPIVEDHVHTPNMGFQFSFPPTAGPVLKVEHVGIVSLANNHTFNYGEPGLQDTRQILDQSGVAHFGDPNTFGDQYVLRETVNGQNFIFVGINTVDINFDQTAALAFVKGIRRLPGDFLVVMPHGGIEYSTHSDQFQENFYRSLIDAGADVVIGAHPHVVEEIEEYHGHLIFYSLGNFIFDQYFSKEAQEELAVNLAISSNSVTYNLMPLLSVDSQPALMNAADKALFLADIASTSSPTLQQSIKNGSIELSRSH